MPNEWLCPFWIWAACCNFELFFIETEKTPPWQGSTPKPSPVGAIPNNSNVDTRMLMRAPPGCYISKSISLCSSKFVPSRILLFDVVDNDQHIVIHSESTSIADVQIFDKSAFVTYILMFPSYSVTVVSPSCSLRAVPWGCGLLAWQLTIIELQSQIYSTVNLDSLNYAFETQPTVLSLLWIFAERLEMNQATYSVLTN